MKEYQKIETLYQFDPKTHNFLPYFYNPLVQYLKDNPWIVSEKIDGMNVRVHWDGHSVEWSGRTDKSGLPKEVVAVLQEKFGDSEIVFEQTFGEKEVYLFMEAYGGKIQGGIYGGEERLIGFDVMCDGYYLNKWDIDEIFDKFNILTVKFTMVENLQKAIDYVTNEESYSGYSKLKKTPIEGLVCVPGVRLYDHKGNRIIVKIKKKDLAKLVLIEKEAECLR